MRTHMTLKLACVAIASLASLVVAPALSPGQEPTMPPVPAIDPNVYANDQPPHHWLSCFCAYDGIPRTYSYYYSRRLIATAFSGHRPGWEITGRRPSEAFPEACNGSR